jgi:putative ABC transport system permease protein
LEELASASLAQRRFSLLLVGAFAGTALLLSLLGLYSVIAYLVTQRTGEIGVRMALGARAADVVGLVLRRGLALALAGTGLGILIALAASRLLAGLVHGIATNDTATFAGVAVLLILLAGFASYIPARRAARVDPMSALRAE